MVALFGEMQRKLCCVLWVALGLRLPTRLTFPQSSAAYRLCVAGPWRSLFCSPSFFIFLKAEFGDSGFDLGCLYGLSPQWIYYRKYSIRTFWILLHRYSNWGALIAIPLCLVISSARGWTQRCWRGQLLCSESRMGPPLLSTTQNLNSSSLDILSTSCLF